MRQPQTVTGLRPEVHPKRPQTWHGRAARGGSADCGSPPSLVLWTGATGKSSASPMSAATLKELAKLAVLKEAPSRYLWFLLSPTRALCELRASSVPLLRGCSMLWHFRVPCAVAHRLGLRGHAVEELLSWKRSEMEAAAGVERRRRWV